MLSKEWRSELRHRTGLYTTGMFSLLAVIAMAFSSFGETPGPGLAGGLLTVTLLFSAVLSVPRTFLVEEEQGTFDLLRLSSDPSVAFLGKMIFALIQTAISALVLGVLFSTMVGVHVEQPGLFSAALLAEALALSSAVSFCGALAVGAANRWVLSAALSLPLLVPLGSLSATAFRHAFGTSTTLVGWQSVAGLFGFAVATFALGPLLVSGVWRVSDYGRKPSN